MLGGDPPPPESFLALDRDCQRLVAARLPAEDFVRLGSTCRELLPLLSDVRFIFTSEQSDLLHTNLYFGGKATFCMRICIASVGNYLQNIERVSQSTVIVPNGVFDKCTLRSYFLLAS